MLNASTPTGHEFASGWNFGPPEQSEKTVGWIIDQLYALWGVGLRLGADDNAQGPPECTFLKLDAVEGAGYLGWRPKLDLATTLAWIVEWTAATNPVRTRAASLDDIGRFMSIGRG